jgi:glycosyltransferase involved in cell wall biosynthesis
MNLLLLFSLGTTLETWKNVGFLDREYRYYTGLMDRGVSKVGFVTYGDDDKRYEESIEPITVYAKRGVRHVLIYSFIAVFVHWHAFKESHIIKSNQSNGAWVGLIARMFFPGKKFVTRCGWVRNTEMMSRHERLAGIRLSTVKFVERLCYRFSNAVIVTTEADRRFIVEAYGIPAGKVTVIPNTVDTDLFFPDKQRVRRFYDPVRFLYIGRLAEMKNVHNLITAIGRLEGDACLTIVGGGDDADELRRLANEQSCSIEFIDNVDNSDLPEIYRRHDVFVMPQLYASGMSKVMIEAMSCGLPTISSNLEAHREVITDGVNGYLCEFDADSIAACAKRVIETNPDMLAELIERARIDVVEHYSMRSNIGREYELYRALLGA